MLDSRRIRGERFFGSVIGIVTNNHDPENRGRVKVKYPWLDGELESYWARVVTFYAGMGRGSYFMPEVDDEVLVMFHGGDPEKAYVIGSVWNGVDNVPGPGNPDGKNDDKWFESRSSHQLKFNDGSSPRITLIDSSKNNFFEIDVNADTITEKAATGDIFWAAPSGSINVDCVDLNVTATKNADHVTGNTEAWTVGNNQDVKVQQGLDINVGSSTTWTTPDAKLTYSTADLTAGTANWALAQLTAAVNDIPDLSIDTLVRNIVTETVNVGQLHLVSQAITHNGVSIKETSADAVGIETPALTWTAAATLGLKGMAVVLGDGSTGMAMLNGGLIGLNPKAMCFPAAKMLDMVMAPMTDLHNIVPWVPIPPVLPMMPHMSMGPLLIQIQPTILINGLPAAAAGANAIGMHIPIYGIVEVPTPPRCIGRPLNLVLQGIVIGLQVALMAHSIYGTVTNDGLTTANKVSSVLQMLLGLLVSFLPFPIMNGGIVLGSPTVAMNGQPTGLVLTPLGANTCTEIPIIPNALPLGFSNVMAGIDFGEMLKQLAMHMVMSAIAYLGKRYGGHPVDVVSGTFFTHGTDVELPGPLPLKIERFYSSIPARQIAAGEGPYAAAPASPLGAGWRHTLDEWVLDDAEKLSLYGYKGTIVELPRPARPGQTVFSPAAKLTVTMADDGGVEILGKDGITRSFEPASPSSPWLRLARVFDRNGNRISLEYSHHGRLNRVIDSAGRHLRYLYGDAGMLSEIRLVHSPRKGGVDVFLAGYVHDSSGDLREVLDRARSPFRYAYDSNHLMVRETNRNGYSFHFEYNVHGQCVETWGEDGSYHVKMEYLPVVGVTRVVDPHGSSILYYYDDQGRLLMEQRPSGATERWEYDKLGNETAYHDPDDFAYEYAHDERGNIKSVTRPRGTETMEYDDKDQVVQLTTASGGAWRFERDERGNVVSRTDPLGRTTRFVRDRRGYAVQIQHPTGEVLHLTYDDEGNVVGRRRSDAAPLRMEYGILGERSAVVTADGSRWNVRRDTAGRCISLETPDGAHIDGEYDAEGNIVRLREGDRETRFEWGGPNWCKKEIDPSGQQTSFEYMPWGDLRKATRADGRAFEYEYDVDGNRVLQRFPDGREERYTCSPGGRRLTAWSADKETRYEYDDGLLTAVHYPDLRTLRYDYDSEHRVVRAEVEGDVTEMYYDAAGQLVREVSPRCTRLMEYDGLGRRSRMAIQGGPEVQIRHGAHGRMAELEIVGHGTHHFERDASGRIARWETPDGGVLETYATDSMGRTRRRRLESRALGRVEEHRYEYGKHLLREVSFGDEDPITYDYDDIDRLRRVARGSRVVDSLRFDPVDNLLEVHGRTLTLGEDGRLARATDRDGSTEYGYDEHGRRSRELRDGYVVRQMDYDGAGQLVSVVAGDGDGQTSEYEYDAFGRRVARTHGGVRTEFGWDGFVLLWQRTDGEEPVYFIGDERPMIRLQGEEACTIHGDAHGVHREVRRPDGSLAWSVTLTSFGLSETTGDESLAIPHRFPGQYQDPDTGLHYNLFRFYDPEVGGYLTPDPIGLSGGGNLYAYAANPPTGTDPLGLCTTAGCAGGDEAEEPAPVAMLLGDGFTAPNGEPGVFTISTHGNPDGIQLPSGFSNDPVAIANWIRAHPDYEPGMPVRLVACNTGNGDAAIAQSLANQLGTNVEGGTGYIGVFNDGTVGAWPSIDPATNGVTGNQLPDTFRTYSPNNGGGG